jgi:nitroreductase
MPSSDSSTQRPEPLDDQTVESLVELLAGRRTVNLFQPVPAPEAELLGAIDAARWAPNHRLTQPWRFRVLGEKTRDAVIAIDAALASARNGEEAGARRRERLEAVPGWFVLTSARSEDPILEQENYAACCCAVQNLSLYLWARGIGVKWTTGPVTRDERFFEAVQADPASEQLVGLFWYGYPALVPSQRRAPVEDIVQRLP